MKKRTYVEAPLFLLLLGVGIAIAARFWTNRNQIAPAPDPVPTAIPRVTNLLRSVPVAAPQKTPEAGIPDPTLVNSDTASASDPPQEAETGILVVQVREEDGQIPADLVWLESPLFRRDYMIKDGRLVIEAVTGTLKFNVSARNGDEIRTSETLSATISSQRPALLEFTLPPPKPRFVSAGLELQRQPDGYWSVAGIEPGSAAEQVGLQIEDAVLTIHGQTPATFSDAQTAASLMGSPGDRIPLEVVVRNEEGELEEHQVDLVIPAISEP